MDASIVPPHLTVVDLVKLCEGQELKAYRCPAGVLTIGHGHTRAVSPGDRITADQAEQLLMADLHDAVAIVDRAVKVPLEECQRWALASFVFNVGAGQKNVKDGFVTLKSGKPSTMLRKLNAGDYVGAAEEFPKWNKAGGRVLPGLVTRRQMERALFEGADWRTALQPERMAQAVDAPREPKPLAKSTTAQAAAGIGAVSALSLVAQAVAPASQVIQQVQEVARQAQEVAAQVHQAQEQVRGVIGAVQQISGMAPVGSGIAGVALAAFMLYRLWRDRRPMP